MYGYWAGSPTYINRRKNWIRLYSTWSECEINLLKERFHGPSAAPWPQLFWWIDNKVACHNMFTKSRTTAVIIIVEDTKTKHRKNRMRNFGTVGISLDRDDNGELRSEGHTTTCSATSTCKELTTSSCKLVTFWQLDSVDSGQIQLDSYWFLDSYVSLIISYTQ
jgi:hypothetical protein